MDYSELTEEQKTKLRGCKTPEEILVLAKEEGYELNDDQLEAISGGGTWYCHKHEGNSCPVYLDS